MKAIGLIDADVSLDCRPSRLAAEFPLKRSMQHRLKQLIQPFATGSLTCFHLADFCDTLAELALE
jgi:hypothetical protein